MNLFSSLFPSLTAEMAVVRRLAGPNLMGFLVAPDSLTKESVAKVYEQMLGDLGVSISSAS